MTDIIIIGLVGVLVVGSIGYSMKRKKEGKSSCGGSCGSCSVSCPAGEEK